MKTEEFLFDLPRDLIAQFPLKERERARLLVIDRDKRRIDHRAFWEIGRYFKKGDVLVLNNTLVFKARLRGKKISGGSVDILLTRRIEGDEWEAMIAPARRIRENTRIYFAADNYATIRAKIGIRYRVQFNRPSDDVIAAYGSVPLPRYIRRPATDDDEKDYQTVFARVQGSIAAPTAGLHFTRGIIEEIHEQGAEIVNITLHIGPGTFRPVRSEDVEEHRMEAEYYEIDKTEVEKIKKAKRVFGVGTSVCRALESAAATNPWSVHGDTDLFIYPGHRFEIIDCLITNFHMPGSTPLLLVCAFAGKEIVFEAYQEAIERRYRFLSYGDAMLII